MLRRRAGAARHRRVLQRIRAREMAYAALARRAWKNQQRNNGAIVPARVTRALTSVRRAQRRAAQIAAWHRVGSISLGNALEARSSALSAAARSIVRTLLRRRKSR